jgi:hypothetical protein
MRSRTPDQALLDRLLDGVSAPERAALSRLAAREGAAAAAYALGRAVARRHPASAIHFSPPQPARRARRSGSSR